MFTHEDSMLPILRFLADGEERKRVEIKDAVADHFRLDEAARRILLPSGSAPLFHSRAGWGLTFLHKAGLVERPKRAHYRITEAGQAALATGVTVIDDAFLRERSSDYTAWQDATKEASRQKLNSGGSGSLEPTAPVSPPMAPEEALERAHETLMRALADEILETISGCSPAFFEDLVVKLLVKMGYGGSFEDAARSVGRSGDGGIDGIIKEDRLGLDAIYVQAKRWQNAVGRPQVQAFVGALTGHRAKKGVFITTSSYTREARDYARNLEAKVVLIDGATLAEYMIEVGLGVSLVQSYEVKRLDSDFFEE